MLMHIYYKLSTLAVIMLNASLITTYECHYKVCLL